MLTKLGDPIHSASMISMKRAARFLPGMGTRCWYDFNMYVGLSEVEKMCCSRADFFDSYSTLYGGIIKLRWTP